MSQLLVEMSGHGAYYRYDNFYSIGFQQLSSSGLASNCTSWTGISKGIQDMKPRLANIEEFVKVLNRIIWQT